MADIRDLRENIQKHDVVLAQVRKSIADIAKQEALLYNQAISGAFDNIPEAALLQRMVQFDAFQEDRRSLRETADEITAERFAMAEEIVNILRRKVGLADLPSETMEPIEELPLESPLGGPHPGHVPSAVANKKTRG